jgi:aconitate hydratase
MGILPLQFIDGMDRRKLNLTGSEIITVSGIEKGLNPGNKLSVEFKYQNGEIKKILIPTGLGEAIMRL